MTPRALLSFRALPRLTALAALCAALTLASAHASLLAAERDGASDDIEWAQPARLAERSLLLDVAAAGGRIIAVGERGHVLISEDGGVTWVQARVPTRSMLTAVAMIGAGHAWAVGHDTVILHSADGGRTWRRQFRARQEESPLLDVWFEDAQHGLAVGAYGLVLETRDGGRTWKRRSIGGEDPHLYAIAEGADGTLYLAGEFGALFRSTDRAKTWIKLSSPYEGSFFGALALADGAVLVFGLRGNLYRSEDGGMSWRRIETGTTASLMSGLEGADGRVIIVGLSGTVLVSEDGGKGFATANRPDRRGIAALAEVAPGRLLVLGEFGLGRIAGAP